MDHKIVYHKLPVDPQQTTILRDGLPGFIFESNRGTKHSFTAETSLGAELAAGWTGKHYKKFKSKSEAVRLKVCACLCVCMHVFMHACAHAMNGRKVCVCNWFINLGCCICY